jgi:hypothetical protein
MLLVNRTSAIEWTRCFVVLHLSSEHLLHRRNDEIRLVELDLVTAAGGNDVDTVRGDTR